MRSNDKWKKYHGKSISGKSIAVGLAYISDGTHHELRGTHPFLSVTAVATDDDLINQ